MSMELSGVGFHLGANSQASQDNGSSNGDFSQVALKPRKPYTLSKSREAWTDEEHQKFVTALKQYDRDWKKIEEYVGTKTAVQIRSHAQKYFMKLEKTEGKAAVPPARPKKKSSKPYPVQHPTSSRASSRGGSEQSSTKRNIPITMVGRPANDSPAPSSQAVTGTKGYAGYPPNGGLPAWPSAPADGRGLMGMGGGFPEPEIERQSQEFMYQQIAMSSRDRDLNSDVPNFGRIYSFLLSLSNIDQSSIMARLQEALSSMSTADMDLLQLLSYNLALNLSQAQMKDMEVEAAMNGKTAGFGMSSGLPGWDAQFGSPDLGSPRRKEEKLPEKPTQMQRNESNLSMKSHSPNDKNQQPLRQLHSGGDSNHARQSVDVPQKANGEHRHNPPQHIPKQRDDSANDSHVQMHYTLQPVPAMPLFSMQRVDVPYGQDQAHFREQQDQHQAASYQYQMHQTQNYQEALRRAQGTGSANENGRLSLSGIDRQGNAPGAGHEKDGDDESDEHQGFKHARNASDGSIGNRHLPVAPGGKQKRFLAVSPYSQVVSLSEIGNGHMERKEDNPENGAHSMVANCKRPLASQGTPQVNADYATEEPQRKRSRVAEVS